ncbi:substrate-binding domain-containing protein [Streptomyces brasiliensis]|nr:substrate-binding domain-containing protein [Streptomyces brasiliensis]
MTTGPANRRRLGRPERRGGPPGRADRGGTRQHHEHSGGPRPLGLALANDQMAVGALHALASSGIRVLDDMVVTGFDGIPLGRTVRPALTTVRQPMARFGQEAVELLVARMTDRQRPSVARVLPARVTPRTSCGCAEG